MVQVNKTHYLIQWYDATSKTWIDKETKNTLWSAARVAARQLGYMSSVDKWRVIKIKTVGNATSIENALFFTRVDESVPF